MSIALLAKVESLEERVKTLEKVMPSAVGVNDMLELIRENKELRERVDALEKKMNKRG